MTTLKKIFQVLLSFVLASALGTANNAKAADPSPGTDLELIRSRVIADLLTPEVNAESVAELVKTLSEEGTWPDINYKDVSRTGFQHSRHLQNMFEMSRAYKKSGSTLKADPLLKTKIWKALDFWLMNDFRCDNWWWNEMGTPQLMINILLVMDEDLTPRQKTEGLKIANRANLKASGARPGGDLIQIAGMLGKQALFARDEATLDTVVQTMASEIKITTGRGLQPDMSFHHRVDNVISTLTYGTGYANSFAYWAVKIAGTRFSLPEAAVKQLIDYYIDGISQSMVYRTYNDPGAMNRDITRKDALEKAGTSLPENLLLSSGYRSAELKEIIAVRKGTSQASFIKDRFFWHSSYLTHQRPKYFASVRMHSNRANNMEEPHNEEGILNHHFGDGSNFLSVNANEFDGIFPVWDWQKIPGTTVVQKPAMPHWRQLAKKGLTAFSGATSDGRYSAAAFDFASVHDPLKARKSWFFFDDEYVCLGAGITSTSDYNVFTTINQVLANKSVTASSGDSSFVPAPGKQRLENISWIHHGGVGYVFPAPTSLFVSNSPQKGSWRSINHQAWATEEPVTLNVFSSWFDHGMRPDNASYAYIVVPGIDEGKLNEWQKKSPVMVLANFANLQAVWHTRLRMIQAAFYEAGAIKIPDIISIRTDQPCIVIVKMKGKKLASVAVSDPTQKLKSLTLTIHTARRPARDIVVTLPQDGEAGKTVILPQ